MLLSQGRITEATVAPMCKWRHIGDEPELIRF